MCLAMVYRGEETAENLILSNVQRIECRAGEVVLTDLMERQMAIHGTLVMANLVEGCAIVKEA